MAAGGTPAVTSAVITASASVVVAVLIFVGNQIAQRHSELRQALLARVNAQLRELYGPLFALVAVNERIWRVMRESYLPSSDQRAIGVLSAGQSTQWQMWLSEALMPANRRMRDVIVQHADLLVDDGMPQVLQDFCSHVASYEVLLAQVDRTLAERALVRHPGDPFVDYVRASYAALKDEQERLLSRRPAIGRLRPPQG